MLLSTKGRYAVMAIVELARRESAGEECAPVRLSDLAESQEIPLAYLEQIFARLKKAELVKANRGPGGGYRLMSAPSDISVAQVILASDEPMEMRRCAGKEKGCMKHSTRCLTHDLWEGLGHQIQSYLNGVSLADVLEGKTMLQQAA